MKNKNLKYYIFITVILAAVAVVEYLRPKPVDWRPSFEHNHKIPFGTYVLFNILPDLFPNNNVTLNNNTVYEFAKLNLEKKYNYIFIGDFIDISNTDINSLLQFVENGNNAFIAANYLPDSLTKTLNLSFNQDILQKSGNTILKFDNSDFKQNEFNFPNFRFENYSLNIFDSANSKILAADLQKNPVYVSVKYGNGYFFICSYPKAFTNYSMVTVKNYKFAFNALSYLPDYDIVWENFYKPYKSKQYSVFTYIFANRGLRIAYYLLIAGVIIFFISNAKRKQRIIKIIKPLKNNTAEFVKTLAGVYFKSKNNKEIALKRFQYFTHVLKYKYYHTIQNPEEPEIVTLAEKTDVNPELLSQIFVFAQNINHEKNITDNHLAQFNNLIDKFYFITNNTKK